MVNTEPSPRDMGSTSLTVVLLTPVFVVIAFAAFQAALWTHARAEARAVARDAAGLVARSGQSADAVVLSSGAVLVADSGLRNPEISIRSDDGLIVVTVTGDAPGIIRGTSAGVEVVEAVPIEGFRP